MEKITKTIAGVKVTKTRKEWEKCKAPKFVKLYGTPDGNPLKIDPDAATFEVTMTKEEHDIILSLWVDAKDEPK